MGESLSYGSSWAFFVYDHSIIRKEEDDLKDAILYFYPATMDVTAQCLFVGKLMGLAEFLTSCLAHSPPRVYHLEKHKFALHRHGNYTFALASAPAAGDEQLVTRLHLLLDIFITYQGSMCALYQRCGPAGFLEELRLVWDSYLLFAHNFSDPVSMAFNAVSSISLPRTESRIFLQASHILQRVQKDPAILAGVVIYRGRVLCTQLSPEITQRLLILKPRQLHLPSVHLAVDFDLPQSVRLLRVHVRQDEFSQLSPLKLSRHKQGDNSGKPRTNRTLEGDKSATLHAATALTMDSFTEAVTDVSLAHVESVVCDSGKDSSPENTALEAGVCDTGPSTESGSAPISHSESQTSQPCLGTLSASPQEKCSVPSPVSSMETSEKASLPSQGEQTSPAVAAGHCQQESLGEKLTQPDTGENAAMPDMMSSKGDATTSAHLPAWTGVEENVIQAPPGDVGTDCTEDAEPSSQMEVEEVICSENQDCDMCSAELESSTVKDSEEQTLGGREGKAGSESDVLQPLTDGKGGGVQTEGAEKTPSNQYDSMSIDSRELSLEKGTLQSLVGVDEQLSAQSEQLATAQSEEVATDQSKEQIDAQSGQLTTDQSGQLTDAQCTELTTETDVSPHDEVTVSSACMTRGVTGAQTADNGCSLGPGTEAAALSSQEVGHKDWEVSDGNSGSEHPHLETSGRTVLESIVEEDFSKLTVSPIHAGECALEGVKGEDLPPATRESPSARETEDARGAAVLEGVDSRRGTTLYSSETSGLSFEPRLTPEQAMCLDVESLAGQLMEDSDSDLQGRVAFTARKSITALVPEPQTGEDVEGGADFVASSDSSGDQSLSPQAGSSQGVPHTASSKMLEPPSRSGMATNHKLLSPSGSRNLQASRGSLAAEQAASEFSSSGLGGPALTGSPQKIASSGARSSSLTGSARELSPAHSPEATQEKGMDGVEWTAEQDGLVEVPLYIQGHQDTLIALLLSPEAEISETFVHRLFKLAVENIGDLDLGLQSSHADERQELRSRDAYHFLRYDSFSLDLIGNTLDPVTRIDNNFVDASVAMHEIFQTQPTISEMILKSENGCCYGYKCFTHETFYHDETALPSTTGGPCQHDLSWKIGNRVRTVLRKEKNIIIL